MDVHVDWLRHKIGNDVREMRHDRENEMDQEGAARAHPGDRRRRITAAARRSSGDEIRRPWGTIREGVKGQRKRRRRAIRWTSWEGEGCGFVVGLKRGR